MLTQRTPISDIVHRTDLMPNKRSKKIPNLIKIYRKHLKALISCAVLLALICLVGLFSYWRFHNNSLVPSYIKRSVNFTVYYPNPKKLPEGYYLNTKSFSSNGTAVIYTVSFGSHQELEFSVQKKPSAGNISNFYAKFMPLNIPFKTGIGSAALGVIIDQSVISIPTNGNAWVLITGPLDINQHNFRLVAQSLTS